MFEIRILFNEETHECRVYGPTGDCRTFTNTADLSQVVADSIEAYAKYLSRLAVRISTGEKAS